MCVFFFFFNDTAPTEIYTLSLHDALPISAGGQPSGRDHRRLDERCRRAGGARRQDGALAVHVRGGLEAQGSRIGRAEKARSEEHTSELQSRLHLVCRLLLEKKKKT